MPPLPPPRLRNDKNRIKYAPRFESAGLLFLEKDQLRTRVAEQAMTPGPTWQAMLRGSASQ